MIWTILASGRLASFKKSERSWKLFAYVYSICNCLTELPSLLENLQEPVVKYPAVSSRMQPWPVRRLSRVPGEVQNSPCFLASHDKIISFTLNTLSRTLTIIVASWSKSQTLDTWSRVQQTRENVFKDKQQQYEAARGYKEHIDQIKMDRELEQYLQARLYKSITGNANVTFIFFGGLLHPDRGRHHCEPRERRFFFTS